MSSSKQKPDDELTPSEMKDLVHRGLRKQKKCALCLQNFFVPELPGAISFKSVLELRKKWNEAELKLYRIPSPSQLYQRVELCIFCMQFFDVDAADTEGVPLSATTVRDRPAETIPYSMSPKKRRMLQTHASDGAALGASSGGPTFH